MIELPFQAYADPPPAPLPAQDSFLTLNNPMNSGFFAVFNSVLGALNFYEQGRYGGLKIDLNEGIYFDPEKGSNWWGYFFEPIHLGNDSNEKYFFSLQDALHLTDSSFHLSRQRSFELIQRYVHLKPHIQKELESFIKTYFKKHFVIGVHHRGTDKKLETPIIPYEQTVLHLNAHIANLSEKTRKRLKIYVATDEQDFVDYMLKLYPSLLIYNDFKRSTNGEPIHYTTNLYSSNYQKGKEALLDCLLLSRCNLLLYPAAASLSLSALKFNPNLPAATTN